MEVIMANPIWNNPCPCGCGKTLRQCSESIASGRYQQIFSYSSTPITIVENTNNKQCELMRRLNGEKLSTEQYLSIAHDIIDIGVHALKIDPKGRYSVVLNMSIGWAYLAIDKINDSFQQQNNNENILNALSFFDTAWQNYKQYMDPLPFKFLCLIRLEKYQEALDVINIFNPSVPYDSRQILFDTIVEALQYATCRGVRNDKNQAKILLEIIDISLVKAIKLNYVVKNCVYFKFYSDIYSYFYRYIMIDNKKHLECVKKAYDYFKKLKTNDTQQEACCLIKISQAISFSIPPVYFSRGKVDYKYLKEALSYCEKAYSLCDWNKLPKVAKCFCYVEYGNVLTELQHFDKAEEYLRMIVDEDPNESTFFNIAYCLHTQKKDEEALQWAKKALFVCEDYNNLYLNADINKALKQCDDAIPLFKKLLCVLDNDPLQPIWFTEADDSTNIIGSSCTDEFLSNLKLETYHGLIIMLQQSQDLKSARTYLELAKEQYPEDPKWEIWDSVLPALTDKDALQQQLTEIKLDLAIAREEILTERAEKNAAREWALRLIKLQDKSINLDLDRECNWMNFENEIDRIIEDIKKQSKQDEMLYKNIENRIKNDFPDLDRKACDFLITAETLYMQHQSSEIDFAAIVVEYCKVLETQLRSLLGNRLPSNVRMLGEIIGCINKNGISPYNRYYEMFSKINEYRHSSAHTGKLKKKDADDIRRIYFDLGLLHQLK